MSTDWNIKCLDCDDVHGFDGANHQSGLMALLCEHADAIAGLAPLLCSNSDIEFRTYWGAINPDWFVAHRGHRLRPIDEYGRLLGQCHKHVPCGECGAFRDCKLAHGHDGQCST